MLPPSREIDAPDHTVTDEACQPTLTRLAARASNRIMVSEPREGLMSRMHRRSILIGFAMLAMAAAYRASIAAEDTLRIAEKRLTLSGYDPVSYFAAGRPEKGSAEYTASYDDAIYWFKSAEHRALFVADPDHYAPQFRGYCTASLSHGQKVEADPQAWMIADGKLYVFGSEKGLAWFQQQRADAVANANENWAKLRAVR
jgi:YHS domain-containing protein